MKHSEISIKMSFKFLKRIKHLIAINIFPDLYKKKFFNTIDQLNWENIKTQNIENELLLIKHLLNKDGIFVDIGANLGQYIYVVSKLIKQENIIAFEPNPELSNRLKKLFKKIHVNEIALSDVPGNTKFKIPIFHDKLIHTRGTLKIEHNEDGETDYKILNVKIDTLDNLADSISKPVSFVKIDVEGAEYDVIKGADLFIKKHNPILMIEIEQRHHNEPISLFLKDFTAKYNYSCYYFDTIQQKLMNDIFAQDLSTIQKIENHGKNRLYINNFIFIPNFGKNQINIDSVNRAIN